MPLNMQRLAARCALYLLLCELQERHDENDWSYRRNELGIDGGLLPPAERIRTGHGWWPRLPGTLTGVQAAIGQGDNISIQGSDYCNVEGNLTQGGVTLGISVFADATKGCYGTRVESNRCIGNGSAAYSIQVVAGSNQVIDTVFANNLCLDPAQSSTAGAAAGNVGIYVQGTANINGVLCNGNIIRAFTTFMVYGISCGTGALNKNTPTQGNIILGYTTATVLNP